MKLPECGAVFASRYRIERELGRGGFATVFLATNTMTGAQAALKVLTPGPDGDYERDMRRRFLREAAVLEQVEHPNVVRLLHAGESDGLLYLASEFVAGEDLSEVLRRRGRFDAAEAEHILVQLLHALGAAHKAGLIHRDMKPENVIVCPTPDDPLRVKLLDFGIARATDWGAPSLTQTGALVGTPRYMAPEQLTNRPATAASDVYALGIVGFELVLGRDALHGGAWGDQLERLLADHVVAADRLHEIDPRLRDVLVRMTAVDVADRLATTSAVERALVGEGAANREPLPRRAPKIGVAAAVVAVLAVISAAIVLMWPSQERADPVGTSGSGVGLIIASPTQDVAVPPSDDVSRDGAADSAMASPFVTTSPHPSAGCSGELDRVVDAMKVIEFSPPACDTRDCPLVLAFHSGTIGDPVEEARRFARALSPLAAEQAFNLIVPVWTYGKSDSPWSGEFDYSLIDRLVEQILVTRCVDRTRVFAIGFSAGVKAVLWLRCRQWLTASAVFGRSFSVAEEDAVPFCSSGLHHPILWLHPAQSRRVPWTTKKPCRQSERLTMGYSDVTTWLRETAGDRGTSRPVTIDVRGIGPCDRTDIITACPAAGGSLWPGMRGHLENFLDRCPERVQSTTDIGLAMWRYFESTPPLTAPPELEPLE